VRQSSARSPIQNGSIAAAHSARETTGASSCTLGWWSGSASCSRSSVAGRTRPIGELYAHGEHFSFGAVSVGQTGSATVSFLNTGAVEVQITQVNITGQPFKLRPRSLPVTVSRGSTYNLQVQFKPSSAGAATGQVTLTSNVDAGGLPTATLSGLGVQSATAATASVLSGVSCNNSTMVGAGADNCFVALNGTGRKRRTDRRSEQQ